MKAGSLSRKWRGIVLSIIGLLLACTVGWGALPEVQAQTTPTPLVDTNGTTYTASDVDQAVQIVTEPEPRYPKTLLDSLVSGRVELQYVVDTTGHAEPNSIRVIFQTHQEFVEPATEAILASVFRPARFRGRLVRQLVQQRIVFNARSNSSSSRFPELLAKLLAILALNGLMALMIGLITAQSRRPAPSTPDGRVLDYGIAARVVVGLNIILFVILGASVLREPSGGGYFDLALVVFFWLLALRFMAVISVRIIWNAQGIRSEVLWRAPRSIRWEDLQRVTYSRLGNGARLLGLRSTGGNKFLISGSQTGFPDFGRDVLRLAPPDAVSSNTRKDLARDLDVAPDFGLTPQPKPN